MKKPIVFRILGILLILALMAGIGATAFRVGYARGLAASPAMAEAMQNWQNSEDGVSPYTMRGYSHPMMGFGGSYYSNPMMMRGGHGHPGFFPLGGLLGFLLLGFLFFGAARMFFFRRAAWHMHGYPPAWGAPTWAQQPPQQPQQPQQPPQEPEQK